jgi:hypothetical protein
MTGISFPVYLKICGLRLHPHWVMETIAYAVAFRFYVALRKRFGDSIQLFATNRSPESGAASLRDLLCCLPKIDAR